MKHGNWLRIIVLSFAVSALYNCSANPLDPDTGSDLSGGKGIPREQINWVGWNAEVTSALAEAQDGSLARRSWGYDSKKIFRQDGGTVGGRKTFGNIVDVPPFAFDESRLNISVHVLSFDWSGQTAAGVEFLPSRDYGADMHITLSWGFLDVNGDEWESLGLQPYYSEDGGLHWSAIEDYVIDPDTRTISFEIGHFTQYGWGLDED
jgi:hypothetical protein